jgi:hypothetical protein
MILLLSLACSPAPQRVPPPSSSPTTRPAVGSTAPGSEPGGTPPTDPEPTDTAPPWTWQDTSPADTGDTALDPDGEPAWADQVLAAPGAGKLPFRDPALAVNGARGGGLSAGSLDVFSLGLAGDDSWIDLGFSGRRVMDGPGADLVVFENPFQVGPGRVFVDPVRVYASPDGQHFVAWPARYRAPDPTAYSPDPRHWEGFAGRSPVQLHEEENRVHPFDPALAGGDAFDLADLPPEDPLSAQLWAEGLLVVRLVAAGVEIDPATGEVFPIDPISNGPDIDAVYGRWFLPAR